MTRTVWPLLIVAIHAAAAPAGAVGNSPKALPAVAPAVAPLVFPADTPGAGAAHGQVQQYRVDAARSRVTIEVGRAGIFRFAGHAHEVLAPALTGEVTFDPQDPGRSGVILNFRSAALQVTGRGDPPQDVPKVQAVMIGPTVLDVARFPAIDFRSDSVAARVAGVDAWDLEVAGRFSLHGVIRPLRLPLRLQASGDSLTASGTTVLRQSDFGIKPISVAGVVKVKDEITVTYRIVSRVH